MTFRRFLVAVVACWIPLAGTNLGDRVFGQETKSLEQCETLCTPPSAVWRSIPWELDLLKAQKLAAEKSKPIFIWSMDGHPLACT